MGKIKGLVVSVVITSLFASLGCVKKRPDVESQGANLGELIPVGTEKTWKHSILLVGEGEYANVTQAEELRVNSDVENIRVLPHVGYKSENSPLLKNHADPAYLITQGIPQKDKNSKSDAQAQAPKEYPIVYELTRNYLVVMKLVPENEVSIQELPLAMNAGSGRKAVTLGGFKVSYFNVDHVKNENGRNTNIKNKFEVPPANYKSAGYFKIVSDFVPFRFSNLRDLYPASYFTEGEWYYAKAVVSTKPGEENGIGVFEGGVSTAFELANKIRFRKHKGYLRGVNVAIAEQKKKAQKKEGDAEDDVIAIPVEWVDYMVKQADDGSRSLEAVVNTYRKETDREFGLFDFVNTTTLTPKTVSEVMASRVIKDIKLDDLHFSKDGFSFTLAKIATGERTRYAFKRAVKSNYKPLVYRKEENNVFGAFYTERPYVVTSKDDRRGDVEANILINRFDPEKPIVFRFSKDTPRFEDTLKKEDVLKIDYREVGRRCVKYWNRAFEVAGTKVKVVLNEEEDGEVGDINANIINIIDTLNESGLAGVGPSLADPEKGEIVAGAANVYVSAYRSGITDRLRNYIRVKSGLARDFAFSKEIQKERPLMAHTQKEVEHFCPDLRDFALSLGQRKEGPAQLNSSEENPYIERCLEKLLPRVLSEVTCHEMGHVFGLRHNFECSADKANGYENLSHMKKVFPERDFPEIYREYYPKTDFMPESSCLMDYMPDTRPQLMVPGLYDIAALAFVYGGKIEKAGTRAASPTGVGELVSFDRNKVLTSQEAYKSSQKFAFCDDYEAGTSEMLPINPLCMRHDFGNTPKAIMNHYFDALRDDIVLNFRRWDRDSARETGRPMYFMENLTSVYKLWRAYLYDFTGRDNAHLQYTTDAEAYAKLKSDLDQRFIHKDFLGVNELFAKLMGSLINIPDLYCVAVNGEPGQKLIDRNKDVKLVNFKLAFDEIISSGATERLNGCEDPTLQAYVAKKYGPKWVVHGEIGYPTDNIQFSKSKDDKWDGSDIIGLKMVRQEAFLRLSGALGSDRVYELKVRGGYSPRALDEPFIYDLMKSSVDQRLFDGIDVAGPVNEILEAHGFKFDTSKPVRPYRKFEADWDLYKAAYEQFRLFRQSEPVTTEIKNQANVPYTVFVSHYIEKRQPREAVYYFERDRVYFFASPTSTSAYRVLNKLRELEEPVRFDLGFIDATSQEGMWQLAELVRDLPVTAEHDQRLSYAAFLSFAERVKKLMADPAGEATVKTSEITTLLTAIQSFTTKLEDLSVASGTDAQSKQLLASIQSSEAKFAEYLRSQTGLTRNELNQLAVMDKWIQGRPSGRLKAEWTNKMVPEVHDRLMFMTEDKIEYNNQRMAMLSLLVTSLNAVSRDPL